MITLSGFPHMAYVRQRLIRSGMDDINGAVSAAIDRACAFRPSKQGETVAVAVGSRRIDRIDKIVDQCLRSLEAMGFVPFIITAMGSHGGAMPDGQKEILARLNITAADMKVPVKADMATQRITSLPGGVDIHFLS